MLFDIFYLMNCQPPVEREVKCNEAQTEVPVNSENVNGLRFIVVLLYQGYVFTSIMLVYKESLHTGLREYFDLQGGRYRISKRK